MYVEVNLKSHPQECCPPFKIAFLTGLETHSVGWAGWPRSWLAREQQPVSISLAQGIRVPATTPSFFHVGSEYQIQVLLLAQRTLG